jgi:single-stranded-DNA-specific exonuclease
MESAEKTQTATPDEVQLPGLIRDLLRKRGLEKPKDMQLFLEPRYDRDLADPMLMTDMDKAIDRIQEAIAHKQKVAVYGDYDIDGITSTALMLEVLQLHGLDPVAYIPDRYEEGYGIHISALAELKEQKVDLVISVDCGITSVAEAKWAKDNQLDLIITDHHDVPDELPLAAVALVNPKRPDDRYPFKELAGVGVAFAVARALQQRTGVPEKGQEKWLLDLVALGTVCDVMPLVGENRVLVKFGLVVLRRTRRLGLVALAQSAGVELADVRAYHLGFVFGPRLNAAGRLEHANYSLELVVTKDAVEAQQMAFQLEEMNHQRRLEQDRITTEADALAAEFASDPVLVLADPNWSHGVVGIVASKIAEKWQKPTLIIQLQGDSAKGSARSSGGYNLIEGLRSRADLFTRLGGHHFAAGFTLPVDAIDELRDALNEHYLSVEVELPSQAQREADVLVDDPADLNWELLEVLDRLEPFGNGNPQPVFGLQKVKLVAVDTVGKDKSHLKLRIAAESGAIFESIGFNLAEKYPNLKSGQAVNALAYLQKNQFNGRTTLQLVVLALQ